MRTQECESRQAIVRDIEERIRIAGYDGRLSAGVANKFDAGGKIGEIFGISDVTMKESNTVAFEIDDIHFRSATNKVVHDGDLVALGA